MKIEEGQRYHWINYGTVTVLKIFLTQQNIPMVKVVDLYSNEFNTWQENLTELPQ